MAKSKKKNVEIDNKIKLSEILADNERITRVMLKKEKFADLETAIAWARENGFFYVSISDTELIFVLEMYSPEWLDLLDSEGELIEYGEGVTVEKKAYKQVEESSGTISPMALSLGNIDSVKFSDSIPSIIEIAKVVKGYHQSYGEIELTVETLKSFAKNFKNRVTDVDLRIAFSHDADEAAAWVQDVFLSPDERTLSAVVKWTTGENGGAKSLSDKKFRYFSPEFVFNYVHPHTLESHGPTLTGGALCNTPFLKMNAIVGMAENKNQGEQKMEPTKTISLADHESKVVELSEKVKVSELKVIELSEKIKTMEKEKVDAEKKAKFENLLKDGKAVEAQRVSFMTGDLEGFVALSVQLNTSPKGAGGEGEVIALSEEQKAMNKKLGVTDAEFIAANKGVM